MRRPLHALLVLVAAVAGCQGSPRHAAIGDASEPAERLRAEIEAVADGTRLWIASVRAESERQLLLETRASGCTVAFSPSQAWLAVDDAVSSNVQVTRLYRRANSRAEHYEELRGVDMGNTLWDRFELDTGLETDDALAWRSRFVAWAPQEDGLTIELSADFEGGDRVTRRYRFDLRTSRVEPEPIR